MALDPTSALSADPSADPSMGANSGAGSSYVIEITVTADGMISVGVESADEESQEEGGEGAEAGPGADADEAAEPAEGAAQPAKSIKEALTMALEIFKNNGQAASADTSDSDFSSGYSGE